MCNVVHVYMGAHRNFFQGGTGARKHGERGARAYNKGLGAEPQRNPGALCPWSGGQGAKPAAGSFEAFAYLTKD